jgi:hypothetical protein
MQGIDTFAAASWIDNDTPSDALTADDFVCTQTGWITDIEFAGFSYYGSSYIDKFRVSIWTDVPELPGIDESHPGQLLWQKDFGAADPGDPLRLGWQEVSAEQFKIDIPEADWFWQDEGTIYWIGIQGLMVDDGFFDAFYWYFQERHLPIWGDDAAFTSTYFGNPPWANWGFGPGYTDPDLYDGPLPTGWTSADMAFNLTGIPEPASLALLGLGVIVLMRRR